MANEKKDTKTALAWALFDAVVERAAPNGAYRNPWTSDGAYVPDVPVLEQLLGCVLSVIPNPKKTQSGVAALALDVWLAYELRCAGFTPDAVWPRARHPRVVPTDITLLLEGIPKTTERPILKARIEGASPPSGVVSASANILGRNYLKQVDVVMSSWATGPEILISTKRMDAAYGKNAANRIEEANGDAKNLRGRHPLAALGFVFGLNVDAFNTEPATARWLVDQLQKLNREDDAYESVALVLMEYTVDARNTVTGADEESPEDEDSLALIEPGADTDTATDDVPATPISEHSLEAKLQSLPTVRIRLDLTPDDLAPATFLRDMVNHVLDIAPVTMHTEARIRAGRPYIEPKLKKNDRPSR